MNLLVFLDSTFWQILYFGMNKILLKKSRFQSKHDIIKEKHYTCALTTTKQRIETACQFAIKIFNEINDGYCFHYFSTTTQLKDSKAIINTEKNRHIHRYCQCYSESPLVQHVHCKLSGAFGNVNSFHQQLQRLKHSMHSECNNLNNQQDLQETTQAIRPKKKLYKIIS